MKRSASAQRKCLFISSVQKELQAERRAIKNFVQNDPLLRRFFDVFLFEDLPASDRRTDEVYLEEVKSCDLYVGLFGSEQVDDFIGIGIRRGRCRRYLPHRARVRPCIRQRQTPPDFRQGNG